MSNSYLTRIRTTMNETYKLQPGECVKFDQIEETGSLEEVDGMRVVEAELKGLEIVNKE